VQGGGSRDVCELLSVDSSTQALGWLFHFDFGCRVLAIPIGRNGSAPASGQRWKKPLKTPTTSATGEHTRAVVATSDGQCPFWPTTSRPG
jgi:hypothetical protein